jgi:Domain of unknown function (DUF222)/HNH endonuclease
MCTSGGGVVDRVAGLAAAVASVADLDPSELPAAVQLDLLRSVWPLLCQLDAAVTRVVGVVNAQGSAGQEGAVSTAAWLRSRLHAGGAGPRVQVAKTLRDDLPEVAAAFDRGEISFTHARIAATTAKDLKPEMLAGGVDKLLAEQATEHAPAVFARAALRIRDHFNPDAADKRNKHPELDQWLDVDRTFHGAVSLSGLLAPDTGELLLQTLGAFMPPVNPDHPGPDRLVPATTRRAEALAQMCRVAAGAAPDAGGTKPQVTVTIDWDTLRGQTDRAHTASQQTSSGPASSDTAGNGQTNNGNTGGPASSGHTGTGHTGSGHTGSGPTGGLFTSSGAWAGARLGSGTPLHPDTARRLACDCAILPVVLGANSEPLDVGRLHRLVTPAIRRALNLRDGGCRFPTCDRPVTWCDAHHLVSWVQGGPTSVDNMILLCRRHHVLVHEHRWTIRLDRHTGTVTATDPNGRPLDIVSHPATTHPRPCFSR